MIRDGVKSDFPDVDRLIQGAADRPTAVLDYQPKSEGPTPFLDLARFVRRIAFAGGWAALSGGLGLSIDPRGDGAMLMALGAGVLGLIFPIPGARRRDGG
jgi:hypothetical protein